MTYDSLIVRTYNLVTFSTDLVNGTLSSVIYISSLVKRTRADMKTEKEIRYTFRLTL